MVYDTSQPLERKNFLARASLLAERGERVELSAKRSRSVNQNSYLHVILGYFASHYGETAEYVKEEYFKRLVNPQIFVTGIAKDRFTGQRRLRCRSTTELSKEEMSRCIERFRNWAAKEGGIYIPTADEGALLRECEKEMRRANAYL